MKIPEFTADASLIRPPSYSGVWSPMEVTTGVHPALPCIYGKYCGPGCTHPGGCESGIPTGEPGADDVDECCHVHDCCYEARGYFACSCDRELLNCLAPKRNWWSNKGIMATLAYEWFYRQPCAWWR